MTDRFLQLTDAVRDAVQMLTGHTSGDHATNDEVKKLRDRLATALANMPANIDGHVLVKRNIVEFLATGFPGSTFDNWPQISLELRKSLGAMT